MSFLPEEWAGFDCSEWPRETMAMTCSSSEDSGPSSMRKGGEFTHEERIVRPEAESIENLLGVPFVFLKVERSAKAVGTHNGCVV